MDHESAPRRLVPKPLWFLAEVTYRCPLHCAFCYNPTDYVRHTANELTTNEWIGALRAGRAMGAAQLGFSGGEPLMRDDIETLVTEARSLGFYSNLVTSGVGLTEKRLEAFKRGGLDHIQLSMHDITKEINNFITDTNTFELKKKVAGLIKGFDFPMVLNVVIHRYNIDHIGEILEMAKEIGAEYVELANTQYYGWSLLNRNQLMPSREQLEAAEATTNRFRERVGKSMKVFFVVPDYNAERPKKCMNGWGQVFVIVTPDGTVLPCHSARVLPGLEFPSIREASLEWIWNESPAFNRYRGVEWMKEPCRTCPERDKDMAGCRCQTYVLTGDAAGADPVCSRSPSHEIIARAVRDAADPSRRTMPILFRSDKHSRELVEGGHAELTKGLHALP